MSLKHPAPAALASIPLFLIGLLTALYFAGAVIYDGPAGPAASPGNIALGILWFLSTPILLARARGAAPKLAVFLLIVAVVAVPWALIRPSNDREWSLEYSRAGHVEIRGETLTFHDVRDFRRDAEGNPSPNWITLTFHRKNLRGVDYFHEAFGGDLLAHPILSYDFGAEGRVAITIETRREKHEKFSTLGGLYKMFELQFIFGTEEELIGVRTQVAGPAPVHLYRFEISPAKAWDLLLLSATTQNRLREKPEFYNILTHNCTTSYRAQNSPERRRPFDIRMLANGRLNELLFETGAIRTDGLPFDELRRRSLINTAARDVASGVPFSKRIRAGLPGFTP